MNIKYILYNKDSVNILMYCIITLLLHICICVSHYIVLQNMYIR